MININEYCIKSCYHEYDKEEFYLSIIREDKDNYYVVHSWWCKNHDNYKDPDTIKPLRKALIGSLYKIVEIPKNTTQQQTMKF